MGEKVYIMRDEDFAGLARRIELHYRNKAERAGQQWNISSIDHSKPTVYDQFKSTWFELCRWADTHGISIYKAMNP